jgi:hypothetical protein
MSIRLRTHFNRSRSHYMGVVPRTLLVQHFKKKTAITRQIYLSNEIAQMFHPGETCFHTAASSSFGSPGLHNQLFPDLSCFFERISLLKEIVFISCSGSDNCTLNVVVQK